MSLLDEILKGKYNAVLLLFALLLVSRLYYTKNIEKMTSTPMVRTRINTLFDIEFDQIRNLSFKLNDLESNNEVQFTNLIVDGNIEIDNNALNTSSIIPSGIIIAWRSNDIPPGWALCDGQNGRPDLRGRFILGKPSNINSGTLGGEESVTLNVNNIPNHTHKMFTWKSGTADTADASGDHSNVLTGDNPIYESQNAGLNMPHNNMPPFYVLNYIIKI